MPSLVSMIHGMLAMGYIIVAMFFWRFHRRTRDALFAYFATAFALLAAQRIATVVTSQWLENTTVLYLPRLVAFLLIIVGIVAKNRGSRA